MNNFKEFPISVYGEAERVNDILTRQRCRIFYRGGNRNGSYITDEFAEKLINTLHYVPVKGIYDGEDYTDHGQTRDEGRIYGIVPETNNFAWEKFLDEDGVEREYACSDVYLYTALYPEAEKIMGKSLSMELYEPSLEYHMAVIKGQKYAVFEQGSFLGLQVLGDNVEPCFEGASFFSLQSSIEEAIQKIKSYSKLGGKSEVFMINFKLSDSEKMEALWALLNTNYSEENNWTVDYSICDIYDDYALVYNHENREYERVYYMKDDETDTVVLSERVKVKIVDVTEHEFETVETLRKLNGGTYELISENLVNAEQNAAEIPVLNTKIEELNSNISTLNTEAEEVATRYTEMQSECNAAKEQIAALTEERDSLASYKHDIEAQHKEAVIMEYSSQLSEEILNSYRSKLDEYTMEDLDMHLAYELKKANASVFKKTTPNTVVPKNVQRDGVDEILSRYTR